MAYRYCEECEKWLETFEYTVDSMGETVCPVEGHKAVVGYIHAYMEIDDFWREHPSWYNNREKMAQKAKEQGLFL